LKSSKPSIVVPVYNDEDVLQELVHRLHGVLDAYAQDWKLILIDDGSSDGSWSVISALQAEDDNIIGLKLMRNFGQQNAIAAGLDFADGDIVVIMDSDLQDRPEDIPKLITALEENDASMAIAKWKTRKDGHLKLAVSRLFYSVSRRITKIQHQPGLGVFRAIRGEVVQELKKYQEKTSTTLSLLYWIGVDYVAVDLERDARFAGKSGYNLKKMLKLTMDRIFSFSMFPIRASIYSGLIVSLLSFILALIILIRRLMHLTAPGWTSIVVLILFLFGLNFIFMGVVGEYLGRIFLETKQRPKYIVKKCIGAICKK
jgi:dolichol-phosphate mannosyltransferase